MSPRWLLSLLCLSVAVAFAQQSTATTSLSVNESATRFLIQDQTLVWLEVVNPARQNVPVHLKLELLDPKDLIHGRAARDVTLRPGPNKLSLPLSAAALSDKDDRTLPWFRLRYRIEASSEATPAPDAAAGIISLSEIDTPDIFALEVSAPRETLCGTRYYTHIRALHPITARPVKDVSVSVEFKFDEAKTGTLFGSGLTDANGYALVALNIPAKLMTDEGQLKVVARHGGYLQEASSEIELSNKAQIIVNTDKPIYQPGQPLHVRALIFDPANHAAANADATLKITDPEGTSVFRAALHTSRFGVANADWTIPERTRLGDYNIVVEMDDENYGDSEGYLFVKISRYDLPNFAVSVKPDRPYYLPHQSAAVEVRADYLFGQPVKRGHVRVVREEERHWNYREQKWETQELDKYEGETDDAGSFVAHIDLKKDQEELADRDYSRFTDLPYAAYFTDPTTNRTEQRRFDLRVSKDAIHIYVAEGRYQQARGLPFAFYVATSYADGTPASCEVRISPPPPDDDDEAPQISPPPLQTIHTNRYGVAKVTGLNVPDSDDGRNPSLYFSANAGAGSAGHHTESFYYGDAPVIRVETDKAIYRPGEPIKISVAASKPEMNVIVDVARESNILQSQLVQLHDGAATFTVPYKPEFQDEVSISAYSKSPTQTDRYDFSWGSRIVIYPRDRDLRLAVRIDRAAYKPGESAQADFHISTADGRPASSALGIVVFDRAVEERARTDQEFGARFGFYGAYSHWRGYDDQVGGVTRKDLQRIDLTKALPDGVETVAELLLGANSQRPGFLTAIEFATDYKGVFAETTSQQIKPIEDFLDAQYRTSGTYPANAETLRRLLFEAGMDLDQVKDPWGTSYRDAFSVSTVNDVLDLLSAGPDKKFGTGDDFSVSHAARPYFRFTGEAIDRAVQRFHARTGGFIRDVATLKSELLCEGIELGALRDPWGQPYDLSFTISQTRFNVIVRSSGPNKRFEEGPAAVDDFHLWLTGIDYLQETRARIERALGKYFEATRTFPKDDGDLRDALARSGIDRDGLRDPWGRRYYAVYKTEARYSDRVTIQDYSTYGEKPKERTEITPVTQQINFIYLRSAGEDGKEGTADDFAAANFSRLAAERSSHDQLPAQLPRRVFFSGATGAIKGVVTDHQEAVVPGAKVKATLKNTTQMFEAETDSEGRFLLQNLPPGFYEVRCDASGFKAAVVTQVPVSSSNITTINFAVEAGGVSETVTVTAEASLVQMSSASLSTVEKGRQQVFINNPIQTSTPRLREYFPETLVWQPSIETNAQGRAQLKFKLADNITTWKMSVIGSTEDGQIGTAETEIKAFQPFFVEHDPPRVLTEGDEISLPVVVRNYLERAQPVDLEIKPEPWFTLLGAAHKRADVAAGDARRETFDFRATASVKDAAQRITATGADDSDAIEKPITVHPDGEELSAIASDIVGDTATLDLNIPATTVSNSTRAELKIYPSLMAHVVESVEAIMQRPYGCGEQTISSTYPSLLLARQYKQTGQDFPARRRAERYLQDGYSRLLNYRDAGGGFTYWGRGEPDLALTAYALRFLSDARVVISVDADVIDNARAWLVKQQRADGSWPAHEYWSNNEDKRRTALVTAYVARVLAMTEPKSTAVEVSQKGNTTKTSSDASLALKQALDYLARRVEEIDEPYLLASYTLAAFDANEPRRAVAAVTKLRSLAHAEGDTTYWSLETNTPFYGWGLAGRVETTALVIQALARSALPESGAVAEATGLPAAKEVVTTGSSSASSAPPTDQSLTPPTNAEARSAVAPSPAKTAPSYQTNDALVRSGLLFLLKQKDRYGVWYSTQATINVLDAMLVLLSQSPSMKDNGGTQSSAYIVANGRTVQTVQMPLARLSNPITVDLSRFLQTGKNHIEIRRAGGLALASAQVVANYYLPWSVATATRNSHLQTSDASGLRLEAKFDKTEGQVGDEIICHVEAERIGFHGYGMMLAEIGLPPGSDVDRASLETAMKGSFWVINQYDVLPDRVVVYLWPRAGGVSFDFKFRPRFGLRAKTAPSSIYDYYNPEARSVVEPATFIVR